MKNNILLGILVLMVIITIPSAMAANTFYLGPQDSTGTVGDSTYVDLMLYVDTLPTGNFGSYQVTIEFDDLIVSIPDSEVTLLWGSISSAGTTGNKISIAGTDMTGSGIGTYTLATMKLNGKSKGVSALKFVDTIELNDLTPNPIAYTTTNGTYTIPASAEPDLVVTKIEPSQTIFADATNVFTVSVKNQGTADVAGNFDVAWEITDGSSILASGSETVTGLIVNEEKSFEFNWKPTSVQDTTVSATADAGDLLAESDEMNNDLSLTYTANDESGTGILPLTKWGYGGDKPLTNVKSGEIAGDLIYTFGDSVYLGGYNNPWTTYTVNFNLGTDTNQISGHLDGIGGGTVKEARLYMYYNWYRYPDANRPADPEAVMTMTFDGNDISTAAKYEDAKGFDGYAGYKYGTFVYDVTSYVTIDGTYQAVLSNAGEGDAHGTSIYSMALLVIFENSSKSLKEYQIAEGHDLLRQYYHSGTTECNYHVLPDDATSTVDMQAVTGGYTKLFTVTAAVDGGDDLSRLFFNSGDWSSPWPYISDINMGTETRDVTSLKADPNTVAFQDRGDGFSATNAILISAKGNIIDLGPDQDTETGRHIIVPITANDLGQFYGTVEMVLNYDTEKFDLVAVHSNPDSTVSAYQDDYPSDGNLDISAWNQVGAKGDVVLATVELEVIGGKGESSDLTLTVDVFQDIYGNTIDAYSIDTTINIINPEGDLQIISATSTPVSDLGKASTGILNSNGRLRHTGDDETIISADVADSGLGIRSVTVDLSAIGGYAKTLMTETSANHYEVTAKATAGIDATHTFAITATDNAGNTATGTTGELTVYRRGDVVRNNKVDMGDALRIARYTVGLEPDLDMDHFYFVGDVQPASNGDHTTNMGDALYIARHTVGLEPAP
jgi:hypothetical protein